MREISQGLTIRELSCILGEDNSGFKCIDREGTHSGCLQPSTSPKPWAILVHEGLAMTPCVIVVNLYVMKAVREPPTPSSPPSDGRPSRNRNGENLEEWGATLGG